MNEHHMALAPLLGKFAAVGAVAFVAIVIDDRTGVSIGSVGMILGCIWWLGRKLQRLEDGLKDAIAWRKHIGKIVEGLPCKMCPGAKHHDSV